MSSNNRAAFRAATNAFSRVWIIEGQARPDHTPTYEYAMTLGSPSQSFGDVTPIQIPNPTVPGDFIEIGVVRGEKERATVDLMGRYALDLEDKLLTLARNRKRIDVQAHFGDCKNPSIFNGSWKKILVFRDVYPTNFSTTDDLGAMESGDQTAINSQTSLSALEMFEIMPIEFIKRADDLLSNEIVDIIIADQVSSGGDCAESDGCQKIYALTKSAGGSPSTPADVVLSLDGGATWRAVDVDTLGASEDPNAIARVGQYLVVVSLASNSLHYAAQADVDSLTDESWTEVTTGFVSGGQPRAISMALTQGFIVGNGGYIYKVTDPTGGVTALDAGVAVSDNLLAVHALDDTFAVAVGNSGAVVKTENGASWSAVTPRPTGAGVHLNAVWVKDQNTWFVGTSNGKLFYTVDAGVTWTEKAFPGSGSGAVHDIVFANDTVGYLSHATAAPRGRILRTTDGGYSWYVLPESSATLADNDRVTALAACPNDVNFVVGGGLGANGSDGVLLVGED